MGNNEGGATPPVGNGETVVTPPVVNNPVDNPSVTVPREELRSLIREVVAEFQPKEKVETTPDTNTVVTNTDPTPVVQSDEKPTRKPWTHWGKR